MDTLTISNNLIELGMDKKQSDFIAKAIDEKNQDIATKQDLKDLRWVMMLGFSIIIAIISAGFGYLINSINNNYDLLNTLASGIFK